MFLKSAVAELNTLSEEVMTVAETYLNHKQFERCIRPACKRT